MTGKGDLDKTELLALSGEKKTQEESPAYPTRNDSGCSLAVRRVCIAEMWSGVSFCER